MLSNWLWISSCGDYWQQAEIRTDGARRIMMMMMMTKTMTTGVNHFIVCVISWWMQTKRQVAVNPQTKPTNLGCESTFRGCHHPVVTRRFLPPGANLCVATHSSQIGSKKLSPRASLEVGPLKSSYRGPGERCKLPHRAKIEFGAF